MRCVALLIAIGINVRCLLGCGSSGSRLRRGTNSFGLVKVCCLGNLRSSEVVLIEIDFDVGSAV